MRKAFPSLWRAGAAINSALATALLALFLLCCPALALEVRYAALANREAPLRANPVDSAATLGSVPEGAALGVWQCFETVSDYCEVRFGERSGFVDGKLMSIAGTDQTVIAKARIDWRHLIAQPSRGMLEGHSWDWDIVAWGDSLTQGAGAATPDDTYPAVAQKLLPRFRSVENRGIGGESSTSIMERFYASSVLLRANTTWIWAGRNNAGDLRSVLADVNDMVLALGHQRYLIGSILNGDYDGEVKGGRGYNQIAALNTALKDKYGEHFIDLRAALIAAGDPVIDAADIKADIVPASLRSDKIHLNSAGYRIVARVLTEATVAAGY